MLNVLYVSRGIKDMTKAEENYIESSAEHNDLKILYSSVTQCFLRPVHTHDQPDGDRTISPKYYVMP